MYDRALEMSRQAAIDELTGQNLQSCDINYWTAIQMLDAILEDEETDGNSSGTTSGPTRVRHEADEINGLDGEDRKSIAKLLEQMRARHASLERKLDGQRRVQHHHHHHHHGYTHSKRASFGAGVGIPGASGASAGVGMVYATSLPARRLSPGSFR